MKKVLLIAGLALCTSGAFAQIAKIGPMVDGTQVRLAKNAPATEARVDYKASIFNHQTKDATVFKTYTFASTETVTTGVLASTDMIDDTTLNAHAHANLNLASQWKRFANRAELSDSLAIYEDYPTLYRNDSLIGAFMGPNHGVTTDNGFMVLDAMDCWASTADNDKYINAWFALEPVTVPTGAAMVDISFHQFNSQKRYEKNFIDYKGANGHWYSFEVNVAGVDVNINGATADLYSTTLPSECAQVASLELRFRYSAINLGPANDHGYLWAVDEIELTALSGMARWSFNTPGYVDGVYGQIPQGWNLPLSYVVNVRNTGSLPLNDAHIIVKHQYWSNGAWGEEEEVLSTTPMDIPAGNATKDYHLRINERGFHADSVAPGAQYRDYGFDWASATPYYWPGFDTNDMTAANYNYGIDRNRWTYRGLPTDEVGKHRFILVATANEGSMVEGLDTMVYIVTKPIGGSEDDKEMGLTVPGYRWGIDNGVIPGGSEFTYQFMFQDGQRYFTSANEGHTYQNGYSVYNRFVTPDTIPTSIDPDETSDTYGEEVPWVFRGMEIVTATYLDSHDISGVSLALNMLRWCKPGADYNFSLYYFNANSFFGTSGGLVTAASGRLPGDSAGYYLPNYNGTVRYNAVNILFPNQPAIEPNSNYMFGYVNQGGKFGPARQRGQSLENVSGQFKHVDYTEIPALAEYSNQITPKGPMATGLLDDPAGGDDATLWGGQWTWAPMIRMIVGPKRALPKAQVTIQCDENGVDADHMASYWVSKDGRTDLCNEVDQVAKGGTYGYYIIPGYPGESDSLGTHSDTSYFSHSVIDAIYIDDQPIDLSPEALDNNPLVSYGDYSVVNTLHDGYDDNGQPNNEEIWPALLERNYYRVYLQDVQENHTIRAVASWHALSIQDIAPEVNLLLSPNPATSQVKLNITGVNGKVNCNIIDMSGRVIYNADLATETEHVINLNGVPAGAYFVRITSDSFSKVEKLIVR